MECGAAMTCAAYRQAAGVPLRRVRPLSIPGARGRVKRLPDGADTSRVELSISPQMRVVALVGLLAAVALAGGMFFLTRTQANAGAGDLSGPELAAALTPAATPATAPAPAKKAGGAARTTAAAKPAVRPKPRPLVAANGVPTAIVDALRRSPAAVVSLTAGGAEIDRLTLAEAQAAAKAAGVPYVRIDVLQPELGRAIARTFGVVEPPATLVYQRPTSLFLKLDGYADSATIAQAAENAKAAAGAS